MSKIRRPRVYISAPNHDHDRLCDKLVFYLSFSKSSCFMPDSNNNNANCYLRADENGFIIACLTV